MAALTAEHATGVSGMHHGPFGRNEFNQRPGEYLPYG